MELIYNLTVMDQDGNMLVDLEISPADGMKLIGDAIEQFKKNAATPPVVSEVPPPPADPTLRESRRKEKYRKPRAKKTPDGKPPKQSARGAWGPKSCCGSMGPRHKKDCAEHPDRRPHGPKSSSPAPVQPVSEERKQLSQKMFQDVRSVFNRVGSSVETAAQLNLDIGDVNRCLPHKTFDSYNASFNR